MSSVNPPRAARWDPSVGGSADYAVVERNGTSLTLHANAGSPVFFDHPLDHVPGMVVLEGCRQAARLWLHDLSIDIEAITLTFVRHLELHEETRIAIHSTGSTTLTAEFLQHNVICARASFRITDRFSVRPLASMGDQGSSRASATRLARS